MHHFVKVKNMPDSLKDVEQVIESCRVCAECKPNFSQPEDTHLIKVTQPFVLQSIDFKGPLPSINRNRYFLSIINEYSRFHFVFPCIDYY